MRSLSFERDFLGFSWLFRRREVIPFEPYQAVARVEPMAVGLSKAAFQPSRGYVSRSGTDLCVRCRADTGIPTDTHVDARQHYVDGMGQHCKDCF